MDAELSGTVVTLTFVSSCSSADCGFLGGSNIGLYTYIPPTTPTSVATAISLNGILRRNMLLLKSASFVSHLAVLMLGASMLPEKKHDVRGCISLFSKRHAGAPPV